MVPCLKRGQHFIIENIFFSFKTCAHYCLPQQQNSRSNARALLHGKNGRLRMHFSGQLTLSSSSFLKISIWSLRSFTNIFLGPYLTRGLQKSLSLSVNESGRQEGENMDRKGRSLSSYHNSISLSQRMDDFKAFSLSLSPPSCIYFCGKSTDSCRCKRPNFIRWVPSRKR